MQDHELRQRLNDEMHSRPGLAVAAPARISHLAFTLSSGEPDPLPAITRLCAALGIAGPPPKATHHGVALKNGLFKYERHGEFYRISVARFGTSHGEAITLVPDAVLQALPGKRLIAVHTHITSKAQGLPDAAMLKALFGEAEIACSKVHDGKSQVWSSFRIGGDGYSRLLIHDGRGSPERLGRLTRRLHEIETYRMMALLALPVAHAAQARLKALEKSLSDILDAMTATPGDDAALMSRITDLSRDIESLSDQTSYRFAAARAYAALVVRRIAELKEQKVENHQLIGIFLDRRFTPAMATCSATEARIAGLAQRCERASNLLRTRVDIVLEAQNQKLLQSMERRARQQLLLQETVEGLSVAAISYYVIGIVGKLIEGAAAYLPFDEKLAQFVSIPAVILLVWLAARRIRARIHRAAGAP
jgi:uncharacterized membrane-anchored protein